MALVLIKYLVANLKKVAFPNVEVIHNIIKRIIMNNLKLGDILYHLPYAHETDSVWMTLSTE